MGEVFFYEDIEMNEVGSYCFFDCFFFVFVEVGGNLVVFYRIIFKKEN